MGERRTIKEQAWIYSTFVGKIMKRRRRRKWRKRRGRKIGTEERINLLVAHPLPCSSEQCQVQVHILL